MVFILIAGISCSSFEQKHPVDYVNVFTGTSNSRWMLGPYACVPFGMIQLGPDNQGNTWMGGYRPEKMNIFGFHFND